MTFSSPSFSVKLLDKSPLGSIPGGKMVSQCDSPSLRL